MESSEKPRSTENPEARAERELEAILDDPDNEFLSAHQANMDAINNADTAVEALAIARELIIRRLERTFKFDVLREVEGFEMGEVNVRGIIKTIESIKEHQEKIGEGGDAFVVVDKNEIREFPPEICYKFAKQEATPRGRNSMSQEASIHTDFYYASREVPELHVGVPIPMYTTEVGKDKLLAMEKLQAKSVDDILRGMGSLPEWLDVDEFCDNFDAFLTAMHERGLYHRDMHVGNMMVRQSPEAPEDGQWGYLIDYGLSAHGAEGMDPYVKEVAGTRFTYSEDNVIINEVRKQLKDLRLRSRARS